MVYIKKGFTSRHCPKCNGNIFVDQDPQGYSGKGLFSWYEWCLQCGYHHDLQITSGFMDKSEAIEVAKEPAIL